MNLHLRLGGENLHFKGLVDQVVADGSAAAGYHVDVLVAAVVAASAGARRLPERQSQVHAEPAEGTGAVGGSGRIPCEGGSLWMPYWR